MPVFIENNHHHVWTDALFACQLAIKTNNAWDRGSFVRWSILSAWTTLEIACQESLEVPAVGYSFKRSLDDAISSKALPTIIWGNGLWQQVASVQELRKEIAHRIISADDLFHDSAKASNAVTVIRNAVKDIYFRNNKQFPNWIDDDVTDMPEKQSLTIKSFATLTITRNGAKDNPNAFRIVIVSDDKELLTLLTLDEGEVIGEFERIKKNIQIPITEIRAYIGTVLVKSERVHVRG